MSFVHIQSATVESATQAEIAFDSIPQTHTDLYLVISADTDRASGLIQYLCVEFNDDTTTYQNQQLRDFNGTVDPFTNIDGITSSMSLGYLPQASWANNNLYSPTTVYIPNYTGSTYKTASAEGGIADTDLSPRAAVWSVASYADSSAITKITIFPAFGDEFEQYTTASLYAITSGTDGTTTIS